MEPEAAEAPRRIASTETLRDRVIEHLKRNGADSISGVARTLGQGRSAPIHRLTVAGYLQALAEAGILQELDRPPSKLYQLSRPELHWSLHQRIHRALEESPRSEGEKVRLALAALQVILGRPIFLAELQHAGFPVLPDFDKVVVGDAVRRQYREAFTRRSHPRIDVPPRDPLVGLGADDPLLGSQAVFDLIRKVLVQATGAEHLVAERPTGPAQAQLDVAP